MRLVAIATCVVLLCAWVLGPVSSRMESVGDVVLLSGYSHGFALCVDSKDDTIVMLDDVTIKAYPHYTIMVNRGHEGDDELINLQVAATVQCN